MAIINRYLSVDNKVVLVNEDHIVMVIQAGMGGEHDGCIVHLVGGKEIHVLDEISAVFRAIKSENEDEDANEDEAGYP